MGRSKGTPLRPAAAPGTNSRIISNALSSWSLPKIDTKDPEAIKQRVGEYFEYCQKCDVPPSVAGCANWLGVTIQTMENWYTGRRGSPEHQKVMTMFYSTMQTIWAQDMHEGNINPVAGIFMGKVFYGYKDTQEIVVQQNTGENSISSAELIAESKMLPGAEKLALTDDKNKPIEAEGHFIDAEVKECDPAAETEKPQKEETAEKPKSKRGRKPAIKKTGRPLKYQETADMDLVTRRRYRARKIKEAEKMERLAGIESLNGLYEYEERAARRKAQKGEN